MRKLFALTKIKFKTISTKFTFNAEKKTYVKNWTEMLETKATSLDEVKVKSSEMIENKKYIPGLLYIHGALKKLKLNEPAAQSKLKPEEVETLKFIQQNKLKVIKEIKDEYFFKAYFILEKHNSIYYEKTKPKSYRMYILLALMLSFWYLAYLVDTRNLGT